MEKKVQTCSCNGTFEISLPLLTGCNGEPHSDEYLLFLLVDSRDNEEFERTIVYRDELIKRGLLEPIK